MGVIVNTRILLGLLLFVISSCEKFEARGFFLSYEDADERFNQSITWNNLNPYTEITVEKDSYIIYVMADSHIGSTHNFSFFLRDAIDNDAIAAVMVGDLTTGHAADYKTFWNTLPAKSVLLTFPVAGNHDIYFDGWKQFQSLFGTSSYLFYVNTPGGSDLYICLDTAGGTLGSRQYNWLKDILKAERLNYRRCVIFTHNNILQFRKTVTTVPNIEELNSLKELFVRNRVDVVITGHDHEKGYMEFGNTRHISLDALLDGYRNAGFLILFVDNGIISFNHFNIP